jgi:hypothetical protein
METEPEADPRLVTIGGKTFIIKKATKTDAVLLHARKDSSNKRGKKSEKHAKHAASLARYRELLNS